MLEARLEPHPLARPPASWCVVGLELHKVLCPAGYCQLGNLGVRAFLFFLLRQNLQAAVGLWGCVHGEGQGRWVPGGRQWKWGGRRGGAAGLCGWCQSQDLLHVVGQLLEWRRGGVGRKSEV